MDKKILIVFVSFILFSCTKYAILSDKDRKHVKIIEHSLDADTAFYRTHRWIAENFVEPKAVIKYKNDITNTIVGHMKLSYQIVSDNYSYPNREFSVVMRFEAKDNRTKITTKIQRSFTYSSSLTKDDILKYRIKRIENSLNRLKEYLLTETSDW